MPRRFTGHLDAIDEWAQAVLDAHGLRMGPQLHGAMQHLRTCVLPYVRQAIEAEHGLLVARRPELAAPPPPPPPPPPSPPTTGDRS